MMTTKNKCNNKGIRWTTVPKQLLLSDKNCPKRMCLFCPNKLSRSRNNNKTNKSPTTTTIWEQSVSWYRGPTRLFSHLCSLLLSHISMQFHTQLHFYKNKKKGKVVEDKGRRKKEEGTKKERKEKRRRRKTKKAKEEKKREKKTKKEGGGEVGNKRRRGRRRRKRRRRRRKRKEEENNDEEEQKKESNQQRKKKATTAYNNTATTTRPWQKTAPKHYKCFLIDFFNRGKRTTPVESIPPNPPLP